MNCSHNLNPYSSSGMLKKKKDSVNSQSFECSCGFRVTAIRTRGIVGMFIEVLAFPLTKLTKEYFT